MIQAGDGDGDQQLADVSVEKLEDIILHGYHESMMSSYQETIAEFKVSNGLYEHSHTCKRVPC